MSRPRVGMQLIIYGQRWQDDLHGVLREIAEAGYTGVETGSLGGMYAAADVKAWLEEMGLLCCGIHSGYGVMADDAKVAEHMDYVKVLGGKYLICSGVAEGEGIEQYEKAAPMFNHVGELCKAEGLVFCYHNHAWEFQAFDGVKGIHRLAETTDPELVKLCIDVYWVHIGGESPPEFVRRYANRAPYFHFKDGAPGSFVELGMGEVDLRGSKDAALEVGADWIVYEQDRTDKEPRESIVESLAYLKGLGL